MPDLAHSSMAGAGIRFGCAAMTPGSFKTRISSGRNIGRLLIGALILSLSFAAIAQESTETALQKLETAVQKELDLKTHPSGERATGNRDRGESARIVLMELRSMLRSGETGRIDDALDRIVVAFPAEPVKEAAANVSATVRKERETKQSAYIAEVNAALKHAADVVRTAKDPVELDGPLKELQRFRNVREERLSEAGHSLAMKVQGTINFLERWQDYLAADKTNNASRARESLQTAANSSETADLIPRSEILARLQKYSTSDEARTEGPKPEQIDELVARIKTLDGVSDGIKELRKIQARSRPSGYPADPVTATLNALVSIERTYREFKAGLPTRFDVGSQSLPDLASPSVIPLRVQLLLLVLPRYLNLPSDILPKSGETVQQFLERVIDEARRRGDSALLTRTRDAQRSLMTGSYYTSFDPSGNNPFIAAQNQEAAGQFMLAVISYQTALKNGGEAVPAKLIGERLAALKAAHPQEYEQGMTRFLNPPSRYEGPPFPMTTPPSYPGAPLSPAPLPIPAVSSPATPNQISRPSASATLSPAHP